MTANEFAAWRQALSVSQARAGEMLGISRVSVGKLERGEVPVDVRTVLACRWLLAMARWHIDVNERRSWMRTLGRWTG
jgi:DNA-binding XRE family transcriptional regulator